MKIEFLGLLCLINGRPLDELRADHKKAAPTVEAWRNKWNTCKYSMKRIKEGPANWEKKIKKGKPFKDTSFRRRETLYWRGYSDMVTVFNYNFGLTFGYYSFEKLSVLYPDRPIYSNDIYAETPYTLIDTEQGGAGTCYIMAAMGSIAEWYDLSKQVFITNTKNDAGIYAIKFYIRGKPWIVTIDDEMLVNDVGKG